MFSSQKQKTDLNFPVFGTREKKLSAEKLHKEMHPVELDYQLIEVSAGKQYSDSFSTLKQLFFISQDRQNPHLNDIEVNAMIGLAYLYGQIGIIQANTGYIPRNEFHMLQHIIGSLSQDHILQRHIKTLLPLMSNYLKERDLDNAASYSSSMQSVQQSLSAQDIIKNIQESLDGLLKDKDYMDYYYGYKGQAKAAEDNNEVLKLIKEMLLQIPAESSQDSAIKQPESKTDEFSSLRKMFSFYSEEKLTKANVDQIIEFLLANSVDKKIFVQACLKAYQEAYDACGRKSAKVNYLLEKMPALFVLFDKYLAAGELEQLVRAISFQLADKHAAENDSAYWFYCAAKAIIFGEELKASQRRCQFVSMSSAESVLEFMIMPGKRAAQSSVSIQPKALLYLPLALQVKLQQLDKKTADDFLKFLDKYQEIDKSADLYHQRPIALFLAKLDDKIIQLIDIMGSNGIAYMRRQLAGTVLTLERMLENLQLLDKSLISPLNDYYRSLKSRDSSSDDAFYNCLTAVSILTKMEESSGYQDEAEETETPPKLPLIDRIMAMAAGKSPSEFLYAMVSIIIKKILPDMGVDITEQQITEMFKRVSPERFARLALVSQKMQQNEYRQVFLHLLKLDLTGGDIDDFLHNTKQENPIGKDLSQHNESIRQKLEARRISPSDALHYQKTYHFVVSSSEEKGNDTANMKLVLWDYLLKLNDETTKVLESEKITNPLHKKQLLAIQKKSFHNKKFCKS